MNIPAGFGIRLGQGDVRPISMGQDLNGNLVYDQENGTFDGWGYFVLLRPGQVGSYETCKAEARYVRSIKVDQIQRGSLICVYPGLDGPPMSEGFALVEVTGFSRQGEDPAYVTVNTTFWRN